MKKSNKNHKTRKTISLILIFVLLFIVYYYLFFSWNVYLWLFLDSKLDLNYLLNGYKIYVDYLIYFTRIVLSTLALSLTIYFYRKSNDKKKFWKSYFIILIIFIILTLIILLPFGAI